MVRDGTSSTSQITTEDPPVVDYFNNYAEKIGCSVTQGKDSVTTKHSLHHTIVGKVNDNGIRECNNMLKMLRDNNLINNKHIPEIYKCNSRENRLLLLAGLIDSDGWYNPNNVYDIVQKNKQLAEDILFLVRSLGMRGTIKQCEKSCIYKGERKTGIYYRIQISGNGLDEIPVLLERKKARPHKQIKDPMNTGIHVVELEEDQYYGFQIDGNSRFLLEILLLPIISHLLRKELQTVSKTKMETPALSQISQLVALQMVAL